jgi:hypothetical protein
MTHSRRVCLASLVAAPFLNSACEGERTHGTFDVILFSYLDRPIFDVRVDGFDIGVAGEYPHSGGGSISGVFLKFGPHRVSWRLGGPKGTARNGERVQARNEPVLNAAPSNHRHLGVHIYADDTVEFVTSIHYPELSERGRAHDAQWRLRQGQ